MSRDPSARAATLTRARLRELFGHIRDRRIVVVGDVMLDRYLVGDTDRLSPEAPVPVVVVRERRAAPGGAANVAANVAALGARCTAIGIVGDDGTGAELAATLAAAQTQVRFVVAAGRPTTCKTRVVTRGQQIVRVDEESEAAPPETALAELRRTALAAITDADALVLEDYDKGALNPDLATALVGAARERGIPVVVDPKYRQFFAYAGATILKPNRRELEAALGAAADLAHDAALPEVRRRLGVEHLLVTLGADGMALVGADGVTRIAAQAREVYDVSGAGDTVTAWLAAALAGGATVLEAAQLANLAAGVEVGKRGVATVTPAEVEAIFGVAEGRPEM